ncbi:PdxT/SNO family [Pisolithus croceorrhizus]|nr:PdxT/SNO family [Pisolithus croceorrhizus]KAI6160517.1 PdxT/SNO family [Pisolithus thermaeus]
MNQTQDREVVGILALQGAFVEHQIALQRIPSARKIDVCPVRTPEDLAKCDALIIPGGESTTIALLAKLAGLLEPLRQFSKTKPIWGTCAGAILLAQVVENTKRGGQELLGGLSVTVARNGWGSQIESFEAPLTVTGLDNSEKPFTGVFIRAPVVLALHPRSDAPPIQVVARLPPGSLSASQTTQLQAGPDDPRMVVAIRQGRHLLTTFHPELTTDGRFHEYFVQNCILSSHSI